MNRLDMYKTTLVNGVREKDFLWNSISKLSLTREVDYHIVVQDEFARPDLISWRHYGTVDYWWIILSVNKIQNPLLDLTLGLQLTIPNILDIFDFYTTYANP